MFGLLIIVMVSIMVGFKIKDHFAPDTWEYTFTEGGYKGSTVRNDNHV